MVSRNLYGILKAKGRYSQSSLWFRMVSQLFLRKPRMIPCYFRGDKPQFSKATWHFWINVPPVFVNYSKHLDVNLKEPQHTTPPKKNTKEFWIINSWLGAWAYVRGVCWTFPSNGFPKRYCIQIGMFSEKRSKTLMTFHSNDWFIVRVLTMACHTVVKSAIHSHYGHSSSEKRVGS